MSRSRTNTAVAPGSQTSFVWPGLQANKTYEWYVTVSDATTGSTVVSPTSRFTTTVNAAPVVTNRTVTVVGDQPTPLTLYASDANGDPLTFQTNSLPQHGLNSNFVPASGTLTYSPARGYRGLDTFTFKATDSVAFSSAATMVLNVTAPADTNGNGLPDAWEAAYGITDANADMTTTDRMPWRSTWPAPTPPTPRPCSRLFPQPRTPMGSSV